MKKPPLQPKYLGSLVFYLGYFAAMLTLGISLALIALPFPLRQRFTILNVYNKFQLWWLRITCGVKYQIEGRENLPQGSFLMVSNHQSEWETLILQTLQAPLCTVLKQELLRIPIFGWGLRLIKPIPLDRSKPSQMLRKVLLEGESRLKEGLPVLIFPQGTRVKPNASKPFSKSAALLASRAGVPLVAVAHNAGEIWNPRNWVKNSGLITLRISPPIDTKGKKPDEINQLAQTWVEEQLAEISYIPALPKPAHK